MSLVINNPENITEVFSKKLYPTIVMWNRLEGRPRTHHFDKALKAEVRDALWMLTKQWQMGEFKGDDAGSPVTARLRTTMTQMNQYKPGNRNFRPMDSSIPLETQVEQKKIPFERNHTKISLDIRLQLGNYWNKLLKSKALNYYQEYLLLYRIEIPAKSRNTDYIYAHKEELQQWKAVAGRCMDGYALYLSVRNGNEASKDIPVSDAAHTALLDELGVVFKNWFDQNYTQPAETDDHAWLPDRLEYQFACNSQSSKEDIELSAEEYYQGHLDWYAFNLRSKPGTDPAILDEETTDSFIPTHVEFDGMPDKRWWKFEDYKTSFGDITPATTDLSKLLLIEFGLIFANDWFLVPFTLPIGSISEIWGLTVTNNFGDIYWIEAAEKPGEANPEWSMFRQKSDVGNRKLFLCPSAMKIQESEPREEIYLMRDEMANMVWGIEKIIPLSAGKGTHGNEYALQTRKFHEDMVGTGNEESIPYAANVYYYAMTNVPENWIPFVPVHAKGHKRNVQLQRASMVRIIDGDTLPPEKIKPISGILREGLDHISGPQPYLVHEEEVPRTGIRVQQAFERTRWLNGQVYVWLGMKKKTGRGEGNSGLAFDQLAHVEQKKEQ